MLRKLVSAKTLFASLLVWQMTLLSGVGQSLTITGKVVNEKDSAPLSFVNVIVNNNTQGTTTNIDGFFSITVEENQLKKLSFNYVGFEAFVYHIKNKADIKPLRRKLTIKLYKKSINTNESTTYQAKNPANEVIRKVYANRKANNPERLKSFQYKAYHKFYINLKKVIPSQIDSSENLDSTELKLAHYLQKHHLFLSEAVTRHQYIFPNYYKKTLVGNRLSGIKKPGFVNIDHQFQPFSFYKEHINVFGKRYLNPISRSSDKNYYFEINDTLLIGENSIYVISFSPKYKKNFEALKGVLYINTDKYAIQNVVFQPVDDYQTNSFRIQQEYRLLDGKFWFPVQLSMDIIFRQKKLGTRPMVGTMRTFLHDIQLFPPLRRKDFDKVTFEVDPMANKQTPEFWQQQHKTYPLTLKDQRSYAYIDTANNQRLTERSFKVLETVTYNKLTYKFLDFKVSEMVKYNAYEGIRLGSYFSTNDEVSQTFQGNGYLAYGLKDGNLKYGVSLNIQNFFQRFDPQIGIYYANDVFEPASFNLPSTQQWFSSQYLRDFLTARMDKVQKLGGYLKVRPFRNLQLIFNFENQRIDPAYDYVFLEPSLTNPVDFAPKNEFNNTEASIGFRFAYREEYMRNGRHKVYLGTQFPIIQFNYKRGMSNIFNSEYDYYKIEGQAVYRFTIPQTGTTTIKLQGGMVQGDVPYPLLYNGRGGFTNVPILMEDHFQVMGAYEFVADQFFNIFIRQNIGRLLYRTKSRWFQPELILMHNMGFGNLTNPERHTNIEFNTLEQGYFESGIMLDKLLRLTYFDVANLNIGTGVFYRYGAYTKRDLENFAWKVTLGFSF